MPDMSCANSDRSGLTFSTSCMNRVRVTPVVSHTSSNAGLILTTSGELRVAEILVVVGLIVSAGYTTKASVEKNLEKTKNNTCRRSVV